MKKAVFLHVFKTGGTSINQWLATRYKRAYAPASAQRFRKAAAQDTNYIRSHDLITGHIFAPDALRFNDTHRIFTIIRKPEAQLMSALWHMHANPGSATREKSEQFDSGSLPALIEAAEQMAATGAGLQALFFAPGRIDLSDAKQRRARAEEALRVLDEMDVVGITERMPETFKLFARRLRVFQPRRRPHYRNAGSGLHGLTPALREILKHHLEIDQQLYDAAVRRFERDLSQMKPRWAFWH